MGQTALAVNPCASRLRSCWWLAALLFSAGTSLAQSPSPFDLRAPSSAGDRFIRIEGGLVINENEVRTAREITSHSADTPEWTNPPGFAKDVFTFARVIFQSDRRSGPGGFSRQLGWWVDFPDADLNLSFRLQQLTTIRTDPDARVLRLTDRELFRQPLIYMEHAGYMVLDDAEVDALRRYLQGGGALFVNDFWGAAEWDGFAAQIQRVLPGRRWVDLTLEHPIFHCIYDLRGPIYRWRIPTMQLWNEQADTDDPASEIHRVYRGEGSEEMHIRGLFDDAGHLLILAIHNSDVSDGWEREKENRDYFNRFSEKTAYPLGVNIIFYLMTH